VVDGWTRILAAMVKPVSNEFNLVSAVRINGPAFLLNMMFCFVFLKLKYFKSLKSDESNTLAGTFLALPI